MPEHKSKDRRTSSRRKKESDGQTTDGQHRVIPQSPAALSPLLKDGDAATRIDVMHGLQASVGNQAAQRMVENGPTLQRAGLDVETDYIKHKSPHPEQPVNPPPGEMPTPLPKDSEEDIYEGEQESPEEEDIYEGL
jgi:hypothetical protein